jgi:hypothetical protein
MAVAHSEAPVKESANDWLPVLDEELSRLPAKYRLPIVLCELEARTRQEAAAQLGWPEGTVAGRLARGRELLATRLLRRATMLSGVLAGGVAQGGLPGRLQQSTVQAAMLLAAGRTTASGVLSAQTLAIAQGVMQTMFWRKIKIGALALLAAVLVVAAGGLTFHALAGEGQPAPKAETPVVSPAGSGKAEEKKLPTPGDEALAKGGDKKVAKARYEALLQAAQDQFTARWKEYQAGVTTAELTIPWSINVLKAQLRLTDNKAGKIAAYQEHLERMKAVEEVSKARFDAGKVGTSQYSQTVYHRIEAEIWLDEIQAMK